MDGASRSTKTAGVAGTPAYMSPEQAQGLPTDQRTDIWSFGCVLYEMLTGRSPFTTASGQVDVFAIVHGPAPAVAAFRPDVPASLAAIVERCLQPDLRRRYQNASSLLADLEAVSGGAAATAARTVREDVPSIAVLPFADMSPDRTQEYFGEGMAEEIIHALASIEGVRVVARTSSFAVKGKGLDVREIGRVLNVGAVLEGSVRASGAVCASRRSSSPLTTGFICGPNASIARQETSSRSRTASPPRSSIASRSRCMLSERATLRKRMPVDPEAYTFAERPVLPPPAGGRYGPGRAALFRRRDRQGPDLRHAPTPGCGRVGNLAAFNLAPAAEAWPKAREAAERALALDRDVSDAHVVAASMALWCDWD